jgi:hypothetical protein
MIRKTITVLGVGSILTKEAEEKLFNEEFEEPTCSNGHTREFYQDLGVREEDMPESLLENERRFDEEDLETEEIFSKVVIFTDEISFYLEFKIEEEGKETKNYTKFFMKSNMIITVAETIEQITEKLNN